MRNGEEIVNHCGFFMENQVQTAVALKSETENTDLSGLLKPGPYLPPRRSFQREMRTVGAKFFSEAVFREGGAMFKSGTLYQEERLFRSQSPEHRYDVFLSHNTKDTTLVANFKRFLANRGYTIYLDWLQDTEAGREENSEKVKVAIANSRVLIHMHTHTVGQSRWIPWQIGYFDGLKSANEIAILPFLNHNRILPPYGGQEYLQRYTQIGAEVMSQFIRYGLT